MKNLYFLILPLFFSTFLNAQTVKVTGKVTDTLGKPLKLANVIAKKKADSSTVGFGIANPRGHYEIKLQSGKAYILIASFMGFKARKKEIVLAGETEKRKVNFQLFPKSNQLEGVELVYEMPVVVRGDTIAYNTESFTNGNEEKLGDVLEKLPGFEVSDEGDIKVQGKDVSKVMVEGKDFFGGNEQLATKNIPAKVLDKVQVLRDYSEVEMLDKVQDNHDQVALNLKLKKDKKRFWFGELKTGIGYGGKTRYSENARVFYYSPKISLNLLGDMNNIGETSFTFKDYLNFTGGLSALANGGSLNLGGIARQLLLGKLNRAKESESAFGAANFSYSPSKKWELGGFLIYSDNQTEFVKRSQRQYADNQIVQRDSSRGVQHNQLGMFKLKVNFKPHKNFDLRYNAMLKKSGINNKTQSVSIFDVGAIKNVNSITERNEGQPFSLKQSLNINYSLDANNIFSGHFQYTYQKTNPLYQAILSERPFPAIFPLDTAQDRYNINQYKFLKNNNLNGRIDYYHVLNDKSNLKFSLGITDKHQDFNSSIFQVLDSGRRNEFKNTDFNNRVQYHFQDLYFGTRYKLKIADFILTPAVYLHRFKLQTFQQHKSTQKKYLLLPNFSARLQFKETESLQLNYSMDVNFPSVQNLAEAYVFKNYNYLFRGNRFLTNSLFHRVTLRYSRFNQFNFTNMNFYVNYSKKIKSITSRSLLKQISQVSIPINSDFPSENIRFGGSYQKTLRKLIINIDADLNFSRRVNLINLKKQETKNFGQDYKLSLESNFDDFPNAEIGYKQRINQYSNGGVTNIYYTANLFANLTVNFLTNFEATLDYNYYNYTNNAGTITNRYSFLNAELKYEFVKSNWELGLTGKNLLNVETINRNGINAVFNYTKTVLVQPRIVMLLVKYEF